MTQPCMPRSAALTLIAGGMLAAIRPAAAQTGTVNVRFGAMSIDAFGEAYYGLDRGIYADNGISPQITTLPNGSTILQAVLGGDLDVGMANIVQVAAAVARGIPIQMIAPASLYSVKDSYPQLAVAKASPIKSAKDLDGGTVAVSTLNDFNQLGVQAWLDHNGVVPTRVHFVELKFSEMGPALQRGTVQAAIITEPSMNAAILADEVRKFADVYSAVAPEFATIVWFATKNWLQKNPDTAKKLVNGIYATARWANSHKPETAEILVRVAKMDPATVAKMTRAYYATSNDRKYVQAPLDLAARYGLLSRPVTAAEFSAP